MIKEKKGLEMSFAVIFSILAGAFILFTAIYGTINLVKGGQNTAGTVCAKQFSILFEPMETGIASGKSTNVSISIDTRIYTRCYAEGSFGNQEFACSQKSGMIEEWPDTGGGIKVNNKYVFAEKVEQGKTFTLFSKQFEMPFAVSEVIVMLDRGYCFEDAPDFIKQEIRNLNLHGRLKLENCTDKDVRVCFDSEAKDCDISVFGTCNGMNCENEYDSGYTVKDGKRVYYTGSLIYASIFSDTEIYECNFKRLMLRIQQIAYLYDSEQGFLATRGCGTAMSSNLIQLAQAARNADGKTQAGIDVLKEAADSLEMENNKQGGCRIYG